MAGLIRETRTVRISVRRRIREEHEFPHGDGTFSKSESYRWEFDHFEDVEINLEIDVDALFQDVGVRAASNRGGKAVEVGGAVTARRRGAGRRVA